MTITVDTPDGGTAEFPDGTDKDVISSAMKAKFGGGDSGVGDTTAGYVGNLAYRAANTGTLGLADLGLAGIHAAERASGYDPNATDLATIRQQGDEFASKYPIASTAADIAGYGIGFGKLGLAARGARALEGLGLGSRLAQAGGTAGEALAADVGTHITHGQPLSAGDVATDLTVGGALGGLIGGRGRSVVPAVQRAAGEYSAAPDALSGIRAAGSDLLGAETKPPPPRSVADLTTAKDAAYQTLETMPANRRSIGNAIAHAASSLTPGEVSGLSGAMKSKVMQVTDILADPQTYPNLTLGDVDSFRRAIGKAAQPKSTDSIAATRIGNELLRLGGQPMADAQMAQARLGTTQKLQDLLVRNPAAAPEFAQGELNNPRRLFDPYGKQAMQSLADLGPKPGAFNEMKRDIANMITDKMVTGGGGYLIGQTIGHGLVGAPIGIAAGQLLKYAANQARNAKAKRALHAAIASVSQPGVLATPADYQMAPWASQAARQAFLASRAND